MGGMQSAPPQLSKEELAEYFNRPIWLPPGYKEFLLSKIDHEGDQAAGAPIVNKEKDEGSKSKKDEPLATKKRKHDKSESDGDRDVSSQTDKDKQNKETKEKKQPLPDTKRKHDKSKSDGDRDISSQTNKDNQQNKETNERKEPLPAAKRKRDKSESDGDRDVSSKIDKDKQNKETKEENEPVFVTKRKRDKSESSQSDKEKHNKTRSGAWEYVVSQPRVHYPKGRDCKSRELAKLAMDIVDSPNDPLKPVDAWSALDGLSMADRLKLKKREANDKSVKKETTEAKKVLKKRAKKREGRAATTVSSRARTTRRYSTSSSSNEFSDEIGFPNGAPYIPPPPPPSYHTVESEDEPSIDSVVELPRAEEKDSVEIIDAVDNSLAEVDQQQTITLVDEPALNDMGTHQKLNEEEQIIRMGAESLESSASSISVGTNSMTESSQSVTLTMIHRTLPPIRHLFSQQVCYNQDGVEYRPNVISVTVPIELSIRRFFEAFQSDKVWIVPTARPSESNDGHFGLIYRSSDEARQVLSQSPLLIDGQLLSVMQPSTIRYVVDDSAIDLDHHDLLNIIANEIDDVLYISGLYERRGSIVIGSVDKASTALARGQLGPIRLIAARTIEESSATASALLWPRIDAAYASDLGMIEDE